MDAPLFYLASLVCLEIDQLGFRFNPCSSIWSWVICIFTADVNESRPLDFLGKPLSHFGSFIFKFSDNAASSDFVLDFACGGIIPHSFLFIGDGIGALDC
jgi:hypothetical protein